jgi:hypothetical protein
MYRGLYLVGNKRDRHVIAVHAVNSLSDLHIHDLGFFGS